MALTPSQKRAQKAYRDRQHIIHINLDKVKDADILEYLRSQCEDDSEFSQLIKKLLKDRC